MFQVSTSEVKIGFSYNADMVAAVKAIPGRRYDGATHTWSVPVSQMTAALAFAKTYNLTANDPKPAAPVALTGSPVADGYYTVVFQGEHVTLRVSEWKSKPGSQVVSYLVGPSNTSDYQGFAALEGAKASFWRTGGSQQRAALATLMQASSDDRKAAGKAYAVASGNCCRCGRLLTTPESIAAGIGPVCAGMDN